MLCEGPANGQSLQVFISSWFIRQLQLHIFPKSHQYTKTICTALEQKLTWLWKYGPFVGSCVKLQWDLFSRKLQTAVKVTFSLMVNIPTLAVVF